MTDIERKLTLPQFRRILQVVDKYHRFGGLNEANVYTIESGEKVAVYRNIKYIRPQYDTRTRDIFCITFDETGFDFRDDPVKTMYERICEWLAWDKYCEMD